MPEQLATCVAAVNVFGFQLAPGVAGACCSANPHWHEWPDIGCFRNYTTRSECASHEYTPGVSAAGEAP